MSLGKEGEKSFIQVMEMNNITAVDVSGNPEYWTQDIDFIITNAEGRSKTVEVKNDSRINRTGNMYIEIANPRSQGGLGWFSFCKADYLAYGDAIGRKFYMMEISALRQYIDNNRDKLRKAYTYDGSIGYLVNLRDVDNLIICALEY